MSSDGVQNAVVTEAVPQDVQAETTAVSAQNAGGNIEGHFAETKTESAETDIALAPSGVPENNSKTEDGVMDADTTQDTDARTGNDVVTAGDNSTSLEDTQPRESDAPVEEGNVVMEEEGDTNADAMNENSDKIVPTAATKAEEISEVKDGLEEETVTDTRNGATVEVKEDVAVEVKDDIEMEVKEEAETKDQQNPESEGNVEAGKEVGEGAAEIKENIIEEVKDDDVEAGKEVAEDVVEKIKENMENIIEEVKDSTEDPIEEVKENPVEKSINADKENSIEGKENSTEEAIEEVKENSTKGGEEETNDVPMETDEIKEDVIEVGKEDAVEEGKEDAIEDNKVVSMEIGKNAANENKEVTVIEIDEDSAPEDGSEKESPEHETDATPSKGRGRRSKKTHESPYSLRGETRRTRKVANHFEPVNYREERLKSSVITVPVGTGTQVKDIPNIKTKIEKLAIKDPTLTAAHKFLYGGRGNAARKVIKKQLLEFSGYLIADVKGQEKVEDDDTASEKFAARANKMTVPLLKIICDLFDIDRTQPGRKVALDREGITKRLLEFMAAPDIKLTNGGRLKDKKRGRASMTKSPKAKRSKKSEEVEVEVESDEEMEEEDEEEEEAVKEGGGKKLPTKKELRKFVRAYVTCFSMEKTTTKHLIQTASDKFDVDVSSKKKDILELLTAEMPSE